MSIAIILITIFALVVLLSFILFEQPVWVGLATAGGVGLLLLEGSSTTGATIGSKPFDAVSNYTLIVIPMYVLMGVLAAQSNIASDVFAVARKFSERLPGGLGVATILASGGFGAVTGSSAATVATIGRMAVGEMAKSGYRQNAAAALVAMGGTLGILIPPSIALIIYASLAGQSVGKLLIAAVVPGVITIIAYSIMAVVLFRRGFFAEEVEARSVSAVVWSRDSQSSVSVMEGEPSQDSPVADGPQRLSRDNIFGGVYVLVLFVIVVGGLYSGFFTATESGAVAAAVAAVILGVRKRRQGFGAFAQALKTSLLETASMSGMIFALMVGGAIFSYFIVATRIPSELARSIVGANLSSMTVVIIVLLLMLVLGAFLDSLSILVIVIPLVTPIMVALGVDGIWFGILVVKAIEVGLVTPPFGLNVFVASGISKSVTTEGIFRAVVPMILAEFAVITVLLVFPDLVTWLPSMVAG